MKTVSINTDVSRRYRTDIVIGEDNAVVLKIKLDSDIMSECIDYYLVHYLDADKRKYISRQLYVDSDGYLFDTLERNQLMTTELSLIVKGYDSDNNGLVVKSPKIVLVIQDSGERFPHHNCMNEDDLLRQLKNVIETITMDDVIYYPERNNIDLPAPISIDSAYLDEECHLHLVKTNGVDIDVGNVRGLIGPKPEKGVDYFTEDDINSMISKMDSNARGTQVVNNITELPNLGNPNIIYVIKESDDIYRWDEDSGYKKLGADLTTIKILSGGDAYGNR